MPKRKASFKITGTDALDRHAKLRRDQNLESGNAVEEVDPIDIANSLDDETFARIYILGPNQYMLSYQASEAARKLDMYDKSGPSLTAGELETCLELHEMYNDKKRSWIQ